MHFAGSNLRFSQSHSLERFSPDALGKFDAAIEIFVSAMLIFTPLAFGSTQAWSQEILLALIAAATLCLGLKFIFQPSTKFSWSWAYLPIGLFLIFCAIQLVDLPLNILC